jgi:hypothetical protein
LAAPNCHRAARIDFRRTAVYIFPQMLGDPTTTTTQTTTAQAAGW